MTASTITPTKRLSIVKHLAAGKGPDVVATIVGLDRATVVDIGSHHGYPDRDKLAWAADILAKKIDEDATAEIPAASTPARLAPRTVTSAAPSVSALVTAAPAAQSRPSDDVKALLAAGKASPSKRTQRLADRILDDVSRLRGLIDAERAKQEAKAKADAERSAATEEIKRLERQLAEAKRRAGYSRSSGGGAVHGDYPCGADGCDRTFDTAQGVALHRRRIHDQAAAS